MFKLSVAKAFKSAHKIDHATSLNRSFELLSNQPYDLVVLDLGLPESFGLETVDKFFSAMGTDHPVIVLTASDEEGIGRAAIRKGTIDFLVKGHYGADDLARAINHALERWRQRKEVEIARENLKGFAHMAAHDLKAPITSISAYASILQQNLDADLIGSENSEYLEQVVSFADRAGRLVSSLLNFSLLGDKALELSDIDLNEIAEQSECNLSLIAQEAGASIVIEDLPPVHADPELMAHVFQNLIGNGIKYRSESPPVITISGKNVDDRVLVSVKDNGMGIDDEFKDIIFEPFKRISSSDASPGFGLGLAICQRIVHAHQGEIWIEDGENGGSNFLFSLPRALHSLAEKAGESEDHGAQDELSFSEPATGISHSAN